MKKAAPKPDGGASQVRTQIQKNEPDFSGSFGDKVIDALT